MVYYTLSITKDTSIVFNNKVYTKVNSYSKGNSN